MSLHNTGRDGHTAEAVERAHQEIWKRFILDRGEYGIVLDYTGLDGSVSLPNDMA